MNLKPELLQTMNDLGVTEAELETLRGRMLFSVTSLEAQITAITAQITTLQSQQTDLVNELAAANVTLGKLVVADPA